MYGCFYDVHWKFNDQKTCQTKYLSKFLKLLFCNVLYKNFLHFIGWSMCWTRKSDSDLFLSAPR